MNKSVQKEVHIPAEVWGPQYWFVFHTLCYAYPEKPNRVSKKKMYDFVQNIPFIIPNIPISDYFTKLLDKYPVTSYLDSRVDLIKWFHFIHNEINRSLGKQELSYEESIRQYQEYIDKKTIKSNDSTHLLIRRKVMEYRTPIIFSIIILIGILIYFLYK